MRKQLRELSKLEKEIEELRLKPNKKKENAVKRTVRRTMLVNASTFMSSDEAREAFILSMNTIAREKPEVYAKLYLDYADKSQKEKEFKIHGNTINNYNFENLSTEELKRIANGEDLTEEVIDVTTE